MSSGDLVTTWLTANGAGLGGALMKLLVSDQITPGSDPSYQICKDIYLYHPLGRKMAEGPITVAQSLPREVSIQEAPNEVVDAFDDEWKRCRATEHIHNLARLARVYGIASIIIGTKDEKAGDPLDMERVAHGSLWFNVLDPLNTAGSLVLNQIPTAEDFNKPVRVVVNGQTYHPSRTLVLMNEEPVYLAYTVSAFGFVGRSVYQRALYPLKSYVQTMVADEMIARKLGLLVAKMETQGSVTDKLMGMVAAIKRSLLKAGRTDQVLTIGKDEEIETLNMMNADGAGKYSRDNILKNIATSADMPASMLNNETLVGGFGEGTEDAKNIVRYIDSVRSWYQPAYDWFDNIVQYRAWTPDFVARMQQKYPEKYKTRTYDDIFSEWRAHFSAVWPSLLIEPASEQVRVEDVKFQAVVAMLQTLLPTLDPDNKKTVVQWAADCIAENEQLFQHRLVLDWDALGEFLAEAQDRQNETAEAAQAAAGGGGQNGAAGGEAKKFGRFDSADLGELRRAVANLPERRLPMPRRITR